jgi:hypothetical protein
MLKEEGTARLTDDQEVHYYDSEDKGNVEATNRHHQVPEFAVSSFHKNDNMKLNSRPQTKHQGEHPTLSSKNPSKLQKSSQERSDSKEDAISGLA